MKSSIVALAAGHQTDIRRRRAGPLRLVDFVAASEVRLATFDSCTHLFCHFRLVTFVSLTLSFRIFPPSRSLLLVLFSLRKSGRGTSASAYGIVSKRLGLHVVSLQQTICGMVGVKSRSGEKGGHQAFSGSCIFTSYILMSL